MLLLSSLTCSQVCLTSTCAWSPDHLPHKTGIYKWTWRWHFIDIFSFWPTALGIIFVWSQVWNQAKLYWNYKFFKGNFLQLDPLPNVWPFHTLKWEKQPNLNIWALPQNCLWNYKLQKNKRVGCQPNFLKLFTNFKPSEKKWVGIS